MRSHLSERTQQNGDALARALSPSTPLSYSVSIAPRFAASAICESIGVALAKGGQPADALPWFERALELEPDRATCLRHMGNTLAMMRADDAALTCLRAARRVRPDWDEAWLDEAGLLLRRGDYAAGWRAYGKRAGQRMLETLPSCWSGEEPLNGKTILLIAEQGLGDTIQFARYAPQVAALAQRVVLEVQAPLRPLFDEVGRDWGVEIVARGEAATRWRPSMPAAQPAAHLPNDGRHHSRTRWLSSLPRGEASALARPAGGPQCAWALTGGARLCWEPAVQERRTALYSACGLRNVL